jgi:glycosyltransferase involved in cell wall biosynthesis
MKQSYIPKDQRKKILLITDDLRTHSGVGNIAREIVLNTCGHFNWVQIAGAMQHPDRGKCLDISQDISNSLGIPDVDVKLYPTDGYGSPDLVRSIIGIEKPDAIFLITDPRYFTWLFQIENEIRKKIPICYLNIWDSPYPYPLWNKQYYESCDLLMSISKQTKNINEVVLGDKIKNKLLTYIPHGLDHNTFRPIFDNDPKYNEFKEFKKQLFKGKEHDFVLFFNSRNIRRKQIPDTLLAFRMFLDRLPKDKADKCLFLLHTDIADEHGTDLGAVTDYLLDKYPKSVMFTNSKMPLEQMNYLYNSSDCQILLTSNEGWGLSLTEALLAGNPIIANQQGGMIDQMRFEDEKGNWITYNKDFPSNHRGTYKKHGEWAFPVLPSNISIQGSVPTPYISDDRCNPEDAAERIFEVYSLSKEERKRRGLKGREWATGDEAGFTAEKMGERVINSIEALFETWAPREEFEFINATEYQLDVTRDHKLIY